MEDKVNINLAYKIENAVLESFNAEYSDVNENYGDSIKAELKINRSGKTRT